MQLAETGVKVGIVGAGAIAYGAAAYLEQAGHRAILWSPSGERTKRLAEGEPLVATGAVEGRFHPAVASSAQDLVAQADDDARFARGLSVTPDILAGLQILVAENLVHVLPRGVGGIGRRFLGLNSFNGRERWGSGNRKC